MAAGLSKSDIKALKGVFKTAKPPAGGNEVDIPEGRYQFKILKCALETASTNRVQVMFRYKVVGGDAEVVGTKCTVYDGLDSESNVGWFKRKLVRLGFGDADLDDFDTVLEIIEKRMAGVVFEGQVKHKDGFQNVYANKLVSAPEDEEEDGDEEEEEDEPTPKKAVKKAKAEQEDDDDEEAEDEEEEDEEDEDASSKKGKAAGKVKGESKDEEAEEDDEEGDEEGDEEDEDEGEKTPRKRYYPTLDAVGKMNSKEVRLQILDELGIIVPADRRKDRAFHHAVASAIVSIVEDDDFKPSKEALKFIVTKGAKEEPAKTLHNMEQQVIDWLDKFQGNK